MRDFFLWIDTTCISSPPHSATHIITCVWFVLDLFFFARFFFIQKCCWPGRMIVCIFMCNFNIFIQFAEHWGHHRWTPAVKFSRTNSNKKNCTFWCYCFSIISSISKMRTIGEREKKNETNGTLVIKAIIDAPTPIFYMKFTIILVFWIDWILNFVCFTLVWNVYDSSEFAFCFSVPPYGAGIIRMCLI